MTTIRTRTRDEEQYSDEEEDAEGESADDEMVF